MPATVQCIDFTKASKRNLEWLADDFFHQPVTRQSVIHAAQHYRDIAATNTVCSDEDRIEFARRARYLTRIAATSRLKRH